MTRRVHGLLFAVAIALVAGLCLARFRRVLVAFTFIDVGGGPRGALAVPRGTDPDAAVRHGIDADDRHGAPSARRLVTAPWGSGPGELGHMLDPESAPEGPMGLAVGADGELWVLDQVNGRVQRWSRTGQLQESRPASVTAQDLALGPRGELVLLDRLGRSEVTIADATGAIQQTDGVVGGPIREGGQVTGLFVNATGIYLEREHTDAVRIGGPDGRFDPERPVVPGRPSRTGDSFTRVALVGRRSSLVTITEYDPGGGLRWQRTVTFPQPILQVTLLDSDRRGHLFVGAIVAVEARQPPYRLEQVKLVVVRLERSNGTDAGALVLPASDRPEETFRDLAVTDDGEVIQLLIAETGVTLSAHAFP